MHYFINGHNTCSKSSSAWSEVNTKYRQIKLVQDNTAKSLRTWSEISPDSNKIFLTTSCRLLIRLKIQEQLCIPWISVSSSAQSISVLLYLYFSRELGSWAIGSGRSCWDFGVMSQRLNNAGVILAWQLCRVDFWNKQKYLSLYDFQTFGPIVKQYFFSFSFPLRPCRKNCCIFVHRNGREMLTLEAGGIHGHRWGAAVCIMCHGSSFCATPAHTGVKNWQLKQCWRSCGAPAVRRGLVLSEGGAAACVWHSPCCHTSRSGASLWKSPGLDPPFCPKPWNAPAWHTPKFGFHAGQGSVGITQHLSLF